MKHSLNRNFAINLPASAIEFDKNETSPSDRNRRLGEILSGTDVGTWEWNVQTGETHFNERWAEMVGYMLEELEPASIQTWLNLVHPSDNEKSNTLLQKYLTVN